MDEQADSLARLAGDLGLTLIATFSDPGRSGSGLRRPGLRNCLELIAQRGVGVLLVTRLDRLSRAVRHSLALRRWIHEHGTDLLVMDGPTHLRAVDNQTNAMMANLAAIMAEHELEILKQRILPNIQRAALHGRRGGRVPLGYRRVQDGSIVIEPHDADLVRRCRDEVLAGVGASSLVRKLAAEGIRDSRGDLLSFDRIRGALTNVFLTGELVYHAAVNPGSEATVVRIPDHHPRILDPVTFAHLHARLGRGRPPGETAAVRRRQRRHGVRSGVATDLMQAVRPVPRAVHGALAPEIVRCGHCHGPMYAALQTVGGHGQRTQVASYLCRYHKDRGMAFCPQPPAAAAEIDAMVFARLQRHLRTLAPPEQDQAPSDPRETPSAGGIQAETLAASQAQVERLTAAIGTLQSAAPAVLLQRLAQAQQAHLRLSTHAQAATRGAPASTGPSMDLIRQPAATWARLDTAGRREALRPLLTRVVIDRKAIISMTFTRDADA